jgi:hypothetical protein
MSAYGWTMASEIQYLDDLNPKRLVATANLTRLQMLEMYRDALENRVMWTGLRKVEIMEHLDRLIKWER